MCRWRLTNEEYEYIKGEVVHVLEKYKVKCIPISGFEIASRMGITLVPYSYLKGKKLRAAHDASQYGLFVEKNGREYIFYDDLTQCYERQNWTILHEIGHIVLDHTGHSQHEEDEANFFAKYAIAPPVLIDKIGATSVEDVYDAFDISYEAAGYAYSYYLTWKKRKDRGLGLLSYERQLLILHRRTA